MSLEIVERSSGYWIVDKSGIVCNEPFIDLSDAISQLNEMETSEELMKSTKTLLIDDAIKIMREHNFEPYVVWSKGTGELLIDLVNQEVICRVDDDGRVKTKAMLEWMGY